MDGARSGVHGKCAEKKARESHPHGPSPVLSPRPVGYLARVSRKPLPKVLDKFPLDIRELEGPRSGKRGREEAWVLLLVPDRRAGPVRQGAEICWRGGSPSWVCSITGSSEGSVGKGSALPKGQEGEARRPLWEPGDWGQVPPALLAGTGSGLADRRQGSCWLCSVAGSWPMRVLQGAMTAY